VLEKSVKAFPFFSHKAYIGFHTSRFPAKRSKKQLCKHGTAAF